MRLRRPEVAAFGSDRSWAFELSPDELWDRLTDVGGYRQWWPWLARFQPIGGFQEGARWTCTVTPPLPYDVSFSVLLEQVDPARSVQARVLGDIEGDAHLAIDAVDGGSVARLTSQLAPANPVLRGVGAAARPLVEWGHDWVLDQGRAQFVERGLSAP